MTPQFQTIRKILDLEAQDGRVEQAIEELEKFAMLRVCDLRNRTLHEAQRLGQRRWKF